MELITIKTFDNAPEAHLLRTKFQSMGIESFIFDEEMVSLNPLISGAIGGIKLKVRQIDIEKVDNIILDIKNTPLTNDNDQPLKCPNCNSLELYTGFKSMRGIKGFISAIISFTATLFVSFGVYPLYLKNVYKCKKCGNEFDKN